jgi:hypothetical protein
MKFDNVSLSMAGPSLRLEVDFDTQSLTEEVLLCSMSFEMMTRLLAHHQGRRASECLEGMSARGQVSPAGHPKYFCRTISPPVIQRGNGFFVLEQRVDMTITISL